MLFNFHLGTDKCHRNYLKRHDEETKNKAVIAPYILNQYTSTPAQLEELDIECLWKRKIN